MPYKRISIDEAKALIDQGGATIADVRDSGSHVAANIEHLQVGAQDEQLSFTA